MKIKTKLQFGFGFLFLVVLFFGGIALFYLNEISLNSKVILKDNYETLHYLRAMRTILDDNDLPLNDAAIKEFGKQLQLEEKNITEPGEEQAVKRLRNAFEGLINPSIFMLQKQQYLRLARLELRTIEDLNMNAIVRKNFVAQKSVQRATMYLGFTGAFSFLILFSFVVNFPGFVANPLRELTEGIQEISRQNYQQRLHFEGNNEFSELAESFNIMASRLNEWQNSNLAKVLSEKLRIETIIEQMKDAIIGLNEKQEILFINTVAEEILNLEEQNIIGHNAHELSMKNDLLRNVLDSDKLDKPIKIYANGKESYFQLESREIIVPTYEGDKDSAINRTGNSAGKVYLLRNITKFKELDEAKTNFIATVSHELKTPISSIKMSLQLLEDERVGAVNTEQNNLINHIKEDTNRLLKITGELLDLSQVETGNLQLSFMAADPDEIVNYAINAVKFQADQKQVFLEFYSMPGVSKIHADIEKTTWVLINFLSNALRYSPEKSKVLIQVKPAGAMVEFSVKDFGKGIEEQYQNKLFDRYFQVPTDGKNKSGTGLGLAISKDFIEAQKGEIFVESEIGVGSRFGFKLPVV